MEQQSIGDLVTHLNRAQMRMSVQNPHRLLLLNAGEAVTQLAVRLHDVEVGCRVALTTTAGWDKVIAGTDEAVRQKVALHEAAGA